MNMKNSCSQKVYRTQIFQSRMKCSLKSSKGSMKRTINLRKSTKSKKFNSNRPKKKEISIKVKKKPRNLIKIQIIRDLFLSLTLESLILRTQEKMLVSSKAMF